MGAGPCHLLWPYDPGDTTHSGVHCGKSSQRTQRGQSQPRARKEGHAARRREGHSRGGTAWLLQAPLVGKHRTTATTRPRDPKRHPYMASVGSTELWSQNMLQSMYCAKGQDKSTTFSFSFCSFDFHVCLRQFFIPSPPVSPLPRALPHQLLP